MSKVLGIKMKEKTDGLFDAIQKGYKNGKDSFEKFYKKVETFKDTLELKQGIGQRISSQFDKITQSTNKIQTQLKQDRKKAKERKEEENNNVEEIDEYLSNEKRKKQKKNIKKLKNKIKSEAKLIARENRKKARLQQNFQENARGLDDSSSTDTQIEK